MSEHRTRNYEARCLMQMLTCLVNKEEAPKWSRKIDWGGIYKLADYQNVANDVYYVIMGNIDQDYGPWKKKFEDRFHSAVVGEDRYASVVEETIQELERGKIHSMVINDFLMRAYYPRKEMRALDVVEILVEPGKQKGLDKILKELDFMEIEGREEKAWSYYKIPGIRFRIVEHMEFTNKKMQNYFDISVKHYPNKEGYRYIHQNKSHEFYLYLIGIYGERYARGRLEVRDVLDFWHYYLQTYQQQDWEYIEKTLTKMNLNKFAENLAKLAAFWFGRMDFPTQVEVLGEMEDYILTKGVKGRRESEKLLPLIKEVADFYKRDIEQERRSQLYKWMFPEIDYMSTLYPVLLKHPGLMKVCWVLRIFRSSGYTIKNTVLDIVKRIGDKADSIRKIYALRERKWVGKGHSAVQKYKRMKEINLEKIAELLNRSDKKDR